ncbi:MAG TPA: hypothetical protein VJ765_08865 [Chitinophagaceae bacterium]|nr:hypothetical protein [Chitinophagaceae bacterium]
MPDNSWETIETFYNVYYYNDLVMSKFNYTFDSLYNHEPVFHEIRYYYFVFHKDSLNGYKYYVNYSRVKGGRERAFKDSILRQNIFESKTVDTFANMLPDRLYKNGNGYVKLYKNPPIPDGKPNVEEVKIYFF